MTNILDGRVVRDIIRERLRAEISRLEVKPSVVILQVGDRPDSTAFINQKRKFAEAVGVSIVLEKFETDVTQAAVLEAIHARNADDSVHGIILQISIPEHLDKDELLESIHPHKDIDGLTSLNTKILFDGRNDGHMPATARGILALLGHYGITLSGKHAVIVGRSTLVGKPVALACLNADATVTVVHKETRDLAAMTRSADILIVAIGDPEFITKEHVRPGQTVIDVGINSKEGKLVGDVRHSEVEPIVEAITPVPGGVGPMTVASLFENLMDAYRMLCDKK